MRTAAGLLATVDRIRRREVSCAETTADALRRIAALDPQLNAFLDAWTDDAARQAAALDARIAAGEAPGPLAGAPIAVKDNICTTSGTTTCGSRMLAGYRSPYDAHVVERLRTAGAVVIGKTNLDEFAMGSSTEHSSARPTRNPWDVTRVPGGSSGGSAAAVAARMAPAALGSDTGGSVRQPAAFCGVTGLKPTYGRVSRYGLVAFGSSLDQIGPLTTSAADAALLLGAIAGRDGRDSTSVNRPVPDYVAVLDEPLPPLRIGLPREYFREGLDAETRTAVDAAVSELERLGSRRLDVSLPRTESCLPVYYLISSAEASGNLARFDGVHYGRRAADAADHVAVYTRSRTTGLGDEVKRRIMLGTYALSSGYYDAYYVQALKVRTLIQQDFERAFESCDVIACPVSPFPAFKLGERLDDPVAMYLADVYTLGASLSGCPAVSIPCGFTSGGLPIGLQLIAPHFAEARLLHAAHAFQQATDWHQRHPPVAAV